MERGQGMRAAGVLFFVSWILCGCCIDAIFENPAALFVVIASLITMGCISAAFKKMKEGV